jgi:hypothetical protein
MNDIYNFMVEWDWFLDIQWEWDRFFYVQKPGNMRFNLVSTHRAFGCPKKFESTHIACSLSDAPYCRLTCTLEERHLIESESRALRYGVAPNCILHFPHPNCLYETFLSESLHETSD